MDALKRLVEIIPLLEPYPTWTKAVFAAWFLFTAVVVLLVVFVPRRQSTVDSLTLSGRVISGTESGVSAAVIEFRIAGSTSDTVTDSEGYFRIEARRPANPTSGRVRISATGYRPYERVIEIRSSTADLGSFNLQPEAATSTPAPSNATPAPSKEARDPQLCPQGDPPQGQTLRAAPRVQIPAGSYTLDFSELTDEHGAPFSGSEAKGFRIAPVTRNWCVGREYGHPAPYIFFNEKSAGESVSITASGQTFFFDSVEVYSSVTQIPYVVTGYAGARIVFRMGGFVPNTFGAFAPVNNAEHQGKAIDRLVIELENPVPRNPVGIDNLALRIS